MPDNGNTALGSTGAIPRHLAVVLLELNDSRTESKRLDKRLTEMGDDDADRRDVGDKAASEDNRQIDLEREARALVETATGVPWLYIMRAGL